VNAPPRVVLVDDDASIRRFVGLALEELPIELVLCASVAEARRALQAAPAALLITDLMMPGETGFELLQQLAEQPALRGPALLAVFSAGINAGTRERLAPLGVWRELDKPVSLAALEACVADAIGLAAAPPGATVQTSGDDLDAGERAAVDAAFGGDAALYRAFRDEARLQFSHDLAEGDRALAAADWPALRRLAHSLKSVLALLGDDAAAATARTLEVAAAVGDAAACRAQWPVLRRLMK
jgi:CheY-like chemotaxis protein